MRNVGETLSLVEDSERSWSGRRGGERLKVRGGDGIIGVGVGHNGRSGADA